MKKLRFGLLVCAIIIIVVDLALIDYSNLIWSKNMGPYLGIISMACLVFSMILSIRNDKKQQEKY